MAHIAENVVSVIDVNFQLVLVSQCLPLSRLPKEEAQYRELVAERPDSCIQRHETTRNNPSSPR